MPPPNAPDRPSPGGLKPDAGSVARFRRDLSELIDVDDDTVLVAVSGGPDSVALLLLMHSVLGERCFAATVDHGLRERSAAEARWVAALCAARGIRHTILTGAFPARAGRTANVSARARALRYRLLEDHASEIGDTWLATAHHADDQLETLVMRLNRGAGVAGLAGVRRTGGRILRPLLGWRREELSALVAACGVEAITDPTNVDDRFDRARLRKVLAGADWLDVNRIGHSARALGEAEDALEWSARLLMRERATQEPDALILDPAGLPDEYLRRLAIACIERIDPAAELTGPGVTRLIEALSNGRAAMLADVLVTPREDGKRGLRWTFRAAPPRRGT